jgi:hypothetical protein
MIMIRLLAASALLAGGALVGAQTASASPDDDAFLDALRAQGVDLPSPEAAIEAANFACNPLIGGLARGLIAQQVSDRTGLDIGQANTLIETGTNVYCPNRPW